VATLNVNQHPKKRAFLEAYAKVGIIGTACRHAEINRGTYYLWAEHDEEFAQAAKRAYAEACDYIEQLALERATVGHEVVKEIYERGADGEPVLVKREVSHHVSDTMLAMMLNGAKPEKYKQRGELTVNGPAVKAVAREFWEAV
jgi:hypothetical protein